MSLSDLFFALLLFFILYIATNLVRSTLSKYAADLRSCLSELKKTKTTLADVSRSLHTRTEELRTARARADANDEELGKAKERADAADATANELRVRLAAAEARLVSLQDAAKESVMRWASANQFGNGDATRIDALNLLRRPPNRFGASRVGEERKFDGGIQLENNSSKMSSGSSAESNMQNLAFALSPSESVLLATVPDLSVTDSDDDSCADDDPFAESDAIRRPGAGGLRGRGESGVFPRGRNPSRRIAHGSLAGVAMPPRRQRRGGHCSSSPSPPPPRQSGDSRDLHGGNAASEVPMRTIDVPAASVGSGVEADTEGAGPAGASDSRRVTAARVYAAAASELRKRPRAATSLSVNALGRKAEGPSTSSSSSLSSLSTSAMAPTADLPIASAAARSAAKGTGEMMQRGMRRRASASELPSVAPGMWLRSKSSTQGFQNLGNEVLTPAPHHE